MKNLTDIKNRIKSVSDTRQITGAMEMISVAKMRKSLVRYENNREYFETIRLTISDIARHTNCVVSRYLSEKAGDRVLLIAIASDKGLAGGFNHNVLSAAWEQAQRYKQCSVFAIGQLAREFFERKGMVPDVEFTAAGYEPSMRDAIEIAQSVIELYDRDLIDEVYIVYTRMESPSVMHPDVIKLLPLSKEKVLDRKQPQSVSEELYWQEIEYEPSPEEVLSRLIPQYLAGIIYGALVQSSASEHSSRRNAMSSATKNASEILESLTVAYHRARQEAVTGELADIITSAMGVKA